MLKHIVLIALLIMMTACAKATPTSEPEKKQPARLMEEARPSETPPAATSIAPATKTPALTATSIPSPTPTATPKIVKIRYRIRDGDTCVRIMLLYGISHEQLIAENPGLECGNLRIIDLTLTVPEPCDCTGAPLACEGFSEKAYAQACFEYCTDLGIENPFGLDPDGNDLVCEDNS